MDCVFNRKVPRVPEQDEQWGGMGWGPPSPQDPCNWGTWSPEGLAWVRFNTGPTCVRCTYPTSTGQPAAEAGEPGRGEAGPIRKRRPVGRKACTEPHMATGAGERCSDSRPLGKLDEDWNLLPPKRTYHVLCKVRRFPDSPWEPQPEVPNEGVTKVLMGISSGLYLD